MAQYKSLVDIVLPAIHYHKLMRTSVPRNNITRIIKTPSSRNMSLLFPRFAYAPAHCGPARRSNNDLAPLFSLFDDTFNEIQRASRRSQLKQWNPRFDIKETKETYTVDAEVPGVEQDNISIEFTDEHTLTVKGRSERAVEKGKMPEAVEAAPATEGTAAPSSEKSHQATVEDEEPANASATQETSEVAKPAPAAEPTKAPEQPKEQYWYSERRVGEFERSFKFPSRVDQDSVRASLKNGVLSITVPKAAAPESRRINIE